MLPLSAIVTRVEKGNSARYDRRRRTLGSRSRSSLYTGMTTSTAGLWPSRSANAPSTDIGSAAERWGAAAMAMTTRVGQMSGPGLGGGSEVAQNVRRDSIRTEVATLARDTPGELRCRSYLGGPTRG